MIEITEAPLDQRAVEAAVWSSADGAVVSFAGVVRDHDGGRDVELLEYSAHPHATTLLRRLCEDIAHDDLRVAAVHRVGALQIGDLAVVVAAASPHRAEAFEACRLLIDRLKHEIPIWKRQHYADGPSQWVGAGDDC